MIVDLEEKRRLKEEFIEENNDYIHYGFLKVLRGNFKMLEE